MDVPSGVARRSRHALDLGGPAVRLTVVGCGTASIRPASAASGYLLEVGDTRLLLDCGPGVVAGLARLTDPTRLAAVLISHLHFDHFLDIVALRYLLPWAGAAPPRPVVFLPPGGRQQLASLEIALSERPGFFDAALDIREFDPDVPILLPGVELALTAAQHYVPAWSVVATADGQRLVYLGDTGPGEALVERARDADLVIVEATLRSAAEDDEVRGHLTLDEAIDIVGRSGARCGLIAHYLSDRRTEIEARVASAQAPLVVGSPGLVVDVRRHEPAALLREVG
jgi:ribonuclease BN (tRNA processing enzyme)